MSPYLIVRDEYEILRSGCDGSYGRLHVFLQQRRLDYSWCISVMLLLVYTNTDDLCYDLACLIIIISSIYTNGWNTIGGGLTGLIR